MENIVDRANIAYPFAILFNRVVNKIANIRKQKIDCYEYKLNT